MSWTDYCNSVFIIKIYLYLFLQLVGNGSNVAHCAFFSHKDQVLGYSPNFYAACAGIEYDYAGEVNNLVAALNDPSKAQANGIKVGNVKYMYIRSHKDENSSDAFLVGNKGGAGISVRMTKTGVLIGVSAPAQSGIFYFVFIIY